MKNSILIILGLGLIYLTSCNKIDTFITDTDAKLSFSLDTLHFDTVFTEVGSATRSFKVYNTYNQPIRISKMYLEKGSGSFFRMNADGIPGNSIEDLEIWPNDSIHVFVETTIDPNQPVSISPFVVEDKVIFETNGNTQSVVLDAWGQNANYLPSRFSKGVPTVYTCDGEWVWDSELPYVIYGEVFIDSCLLRIMEGTQIYVHGGVARNDVFGIFNDGILYFLEEGKLSIEGTQDNPVVFQGDRLEDVFSDEPAQWYGIILGKKSKGHKIEHAIIKNSSFGLYADSLSSVNISNSQFHNTGGGGLIAFHSFMDADNCLIYNNGSDALQLIFGGKYNFRHCTIASYGSNASALSMSNVFCYASQTDPCAIKKTYPLIVNMENCIATGSRLDQVKLLDENDRTLPAFFKVNMENCVVRTNKLLTDQQGLYADFYETICQNCVEDKGEENLFLDRDMDDYHLDTLSLATDKGKIISAIPLDLDGNTRINAPDIGCYEYIK